MKYIFIIIPLLLIIIAVALVLAKKKKAGSQSVWPFYKKKKILSDVEQVLYFRLVKALPDNIILAQVQVSRVLGVKKGFNFNEWNNRINRLSYDFVICRKDGFPLAAIELDDSTHNDKSRKDTDQKKDKATKDAELNIIRWDVKALPTDSEIRQKILAFN